MKHKLILTTCCILHFAFCISVFAQENKVIKLYDGAAPGSENWNWTETNYGPICFNVVEPTLTVFEADKSIANGMAVIVAPGGGFHFLMYDGEGVQVAKWLNAKGITAFVLKYRLNRLPDKDPVGEYQKFVQKPMDSIMQIIQPTVAMAITDGKTAMKYVRSHAAEYGIAENKIGIIGFSAGGTLVSGLIYNYENAVERPDFAAAIYPGGGTGNGVPVDAPPLFIAAATDDDYHLNFDCIRLYDEWAKAGKSVELHIYRGGKHGFALKENHIPTDTWIDRFYEWLMDIYK